MKILLISTNADEAGAPRHVETLVQGLKLEFSFILIFGEKGPVSERLKEQGHIVHIVKEMRSSIRPFKDLLALFKIIHIVKDCNPDIIHCHSAKAGMLGRLAALVCGKRWLYTVHGWGWRGVSALTGKIITLIEYILKNIPYGFYIFVAKAVMNDALNKVKIDQNKGIVIYNGVPAIKACFPPKSDFLTVMMPARVSSAKDHYSLISAFELVNDSKMKLLLCGDGTDTSEFKEFAKSLAPKNFGSISFLGQRSDIDKVYEQSDIVALISNFEALPLSIIEAMSCSRAIIATNVGGIPELIDGQENGILVKLNCTGDIVNALIKLKDSHVRTKLGNAAKRAFEERFTKDAMLTSTARIYLTLGIK